MSEPHTLHARFQKYVDARGLVFKISTPSGRKLSEEAVEYAIEVAAGDHEAAKLELGDVVLAACRQAQLLGTTVEACIEAKIAHDTGRDHANDCGRLNLDLSGQTPDMDCSGCRGQS